MIELSESIRLCVERLEGILHRDFGGSGRNLPERLEKADIPEPLKEDLRHVIRRIGNEEELREVGPTMELVFLCGQVYERLEALSALRLAEPLTYVQPDGKPSPALDNGDIATVAEFAQAWNHFMYKVADFVLKLLLVTAVVLFIGLMIGLI